jgi:hypothetical protein
VPDRDEGAKRNRGCVFFERCFEKKTQGKQKKDTSLYKKIDKEA